LERILNATEDGEGGAGFLLRILARLSCGKMLTNIDSV